MGKQKDKIIVDIVSDVACPWCYIGKRRLEGALAEWNGAGVDITWHPFQLNPTIPDSGLDRDTYLTNKFGDLERTKEMTDRLTDAGCDLGIEFNFGERWLAVNTLPLHQLLDVAGEEGFKDQLKERLFYGYFTENLHLNDSEVLHTIMAEFGWETKKTQKIIADEGIAYAVKREIGYYQKMGVSGVPFFIINNEYGISGAQPSSFFIEAFHKMGPLKIIARGDSYGLDG